MNFLEIFAKRNRWIYKAFWNFLKVLVKKKNSSDSDSKLLSIMNWPLVTSYHLSEKPTWFILMSWAISYPFFFLATSSFLDVPEVPTFQWKMDSKQNRWWFSSFLIFPSIWKRRFMKQKIVSALLERKFTAISSSGGDRKLIWIHWLDRKQIMKIHIFLCCFLGDGLF